MTRWIRAGETAEATINGRNYLIEKMYGAYVVSCDGELIAGSYYTSKEAKAAAEAHAAHPTPAKQGVHIDNIAGQQLIDILKRSFTTAQIQDFIDASPFDEPDTGAPEGGPLG